MRFAQPESLQNRLLVLVIGLLMVVWVGTAALTSIDTRHELDELLDGHLAQAAALLVVQQAHSDGDDDDHLADAPSLHKYAPKVAFQVFHAGHLLMRSHNAGTLPMTNIFSGFNTVRMEDGTAWRVFATQGAESDVQVYVGEQVASRDSILWAVLRSVLLPLALALPILAVALWWAVRRGLLPLRELSHTLALRQPHTLEPLAQVEMPTEMLPMIQALNDLFERIAHMIASERRFTADAAHELRTPIAAIRAQAQVAQGAGSDVAQREHALQATLAGCDRATRLVEQLLTLARLEATSPTAMPAALETTAPRVDLSSITRHVAADLVPTALARQHTLELEAEAPCPIAANDMLTAVLVRNLVDNAIRYSPNGARIRVCVLHEAAESTLLVEDSGTAMTALEMARLGERFFRVLGGGESGSGLGWSIVKRIADVSHAQVQVSRSALLGGLAVQVVWPTPLKSALLQTLPP